MFDFSAWEVLLVIIVALIILGPQRLPVVAKTLGSWFGTVKHLFDKAKVEMSEQEKHFQYQENLRKAQDAEKED